MKSAKSFLRLPVLVVTVCVVGLGVFVAATWGIQRQPPDLSGGPVVVPSSSGTTSGTPAHPSSGAPSSRPANDPSYAACEVEPGTPLPAGDDADDRGDDGRDADDGREDTDACGD